jgi:hypothetical protein
LSEHVFKLKSHLSQTLTQHHDVAVLHWRVELEVILGVPNIPLRVMLVAHKVCPANIYTFA